MLNTQLFLGGVTAEAFKGHKEASFIFYTKILEGMVCWKDVNYKLASMKAFFLRHCSGKYGWGTAALHKILLLHANDKIYGEAEAQFPWILEERLNITENEL